MCAVPMPCAELACPMQACEKAMDLQLDICKALRDLPMDEAMLNQVIADHLFRTGWFEVGELFAREAGLMGVEELRRNYEEMHQILKAVSCLCCVYAWVSLKTTTLQCLDPLSLKRPCMRTCRSRLGTCSQRWTGQISTNSAHPTRPPWLSSLSCSPSAS
jgi:hypothetical protein